MRVRDNHIELIGHLTEMPDCDRTEGGTLYSKFRFAVNVEKTENLGYKSPKYIDVTLLGISAFGLWEFYRLNEEIQIYGKLTHVSYVDENGTKIYREKVVADDVCFINRADELEQFADSEYVSEDGVVL